MAEDAALAAIVTTEVPPEDKHRWLLDVSNWGRESARRRNRQTKLPTEVSKFVDMLSAATELADIAPESGDQSVRLSARKGGAYAYLQ